MHHGRGFAITRFANIRCTFSVTLLVNVVLCFPLQQAAGQLPPEAGVASVASERRVSELNISITAFEPGVPSDPLLYRDLQVFPRIRAVEALLLPFMLREILVKTNEWGAVRVVPEPDLAAELLLSGVIVRSDGEVLELQVRATDASGRVWLDQAYVSAATSSNGQSGIESGRSGYQKLFDSIAEDLYMARTLHDDKALADIVQVSSLRYAYELAPSVFTGYLDSAPDGTFIIQRLPADDDPMFGRIERIRQVEYLVIDTVDERFQALNAEIESIYDLWREYRRQVAQYQSDEVTRRQAARSDAPRGSYEAIQTLYDNYRWARSEEQLRESRAAAFDNEVGPTVMAMELRVAELEGWLEQQYAEWRSILAEILYLETGVEE